MGRLSRIASKVPPLAVRPVRGLFVAFRLALLFGWLIVGLVLLRLAPRPLSGAAALVPGRVTAVAGPRSAHYTEIDYDATSGSRAALRRFADGPGSAFLEWTFADFDAQGNPVINYPAAASDAEVQRTYLRSEFEPLWLQTSGGTVYLIYPEGTLVPALP